jgi:hypothetical protein
MKRKTTLSIALVLSIVLVTLTSSDSTARAEPQGTFRFDSGLITLGPDQLLRLTVDGGAGNDAMNVRFRVMHYPQGICNGGICKTAVVSQNLSAPIMLLPGEAASATFPTTVAGESVRGVVLTNSRDAKVTFQIIDMTTGNVVGAWTDDNGAPSDLG